MVKIISGGQTGVDRGALDAALQLGIECGGFCPAGRLAEDGRIPKCYPLTEIPTTDYSARTRQNVIDSDGTLIVAKGELTGGTRETLEFCREVGKPHLVINCNCGLAGETINAVVAFFQRVSSRAEARDLADVRKRCNETGGPSHSLGMTIINVAGPRASQWAAGQEIAYHILSAVLRRLSGHEGTGEYSAE